jgi:hypothetical protein
VDLFNLVQDSDWCQTCVNTVVSLLVP